MEYIMKDWFENFNEYLTAWEELMKAWRQRLITRKEYEESFADLKLIYGLVSICIHQN